MKFIVAPGRFREAFGVRRCSAALEAFRNGKSLFLRVTRDHSYPCPSRQRPGRTRQRINFRKMDPTSSQRPHLKAHYFRTPKRLHVLQRGLLTVMRDFRWELEAWAVFSNHYHFVAHCRSDLEDASSLSQMLGVLHTRTAGWINRLDKTPGRKVWHNFWDTRLTYQKSYLARLNYVHQNMQGPFVCL